MDLGTALTHLSPEPLIIDDGAARSSGALAPMIIPLAAVPAATRRDWFAASERVPLIARVQTLLEAGDAPAAWRLLQQQPRGLARDGLLPTLSWWAAQQLADLQAPAARRGVVVLGTDDVQTRRRIARHAERAIEDLREITADLPWPIWTGGLAVVLHHQEVLGCPAEADLLARPALPVVRLDPDSSDLPGDLAQLTTRVLLALRAHPERPWPAWLQVGLPGVVRLKTIGQGPLPKAMLLRRQAAGHDGLLATLSATDPTTIDADLAVAICAPLCHSSQRQHLGSLMDLLRNGSASTTAIAVAYDLNLADLLSQR